MPMARSPGCHQSRPAVRGVRQQKRLAVRGKLRQPQEGLTLAAAEARIRELEDKGNVLKPLRERMAAFNCEIAKWWSGS